MTGQKPALLSAVVPVARVVRATSDRSRAALPRWFARVCLHLLLLAASSTSLSGVASAELGTPLVWYAANVGSEGFACGGCSGQSFEGCGCKGWLSCQQGICESAGGYGEPCRLNDDRPVKTGCYDYYQGCVDNVCVPIGTAGEVCRRESYYNNPLLSSWGQNPNQWPVNCDGTLSCIDGYCEQLPHQFDPPPPPCDGQEGCDCRPADRRIEGCDAEMLCDQHRNCRDIWKLTLRAAYASQAVYDLEDSDEDSMEDNLARVGGLRKVAWSGEVGWLDDVEGMIAANEDVIVVAIAGSESLQDWLANAHIAGAEWLAVAFPFLIPNALADPVDPVDPFDEYDEGWLPCGPKNKVSCYTSVKVHPGFLTYAHDLYGEFLKSALRAEHNANPYRPIHVVGHSLGGAVAQLIAAQIVSDMNLNVDAVVTFGSPKVGDENWELAYETMLHRATHRWVVADDPIPNLPALDGWERAGQQHYINLDRYRLDSPDHAKKPREVRVGDHPLMGSYVPEIEALAPCDPFSQSCRY